MRKRFIYHYFSRLRRYKSVKKQVFCWFKAVRAAKGKATDYWQWVCIFRMIILLIINILFQVLFFFIISVAFPAEGRMKSWGEIPKNGFLKNTSKPYQNLFNIHVPWQIKFILKIFWCPIIGFTYSLPILALEGGE